MDREMPRAVPRLPREPGAYRFRDAAGGVLYIGWATALRSRVASYWSDLGDRHLAPMVARVARVEAVACDSAHEAAWLERNLLARARPRWPPRRPAGRASRGAAPSWPRCSARSRTAEALASR
ncbi:MAG TPA: nucleotide excision repair endonuclease [Streptosporangiaceae bacterium]